MTPAEALALRKRLGLSQLELAAALGFANPANGARKIRAWEEGRRGLQDYPPPPTAAATMRYLESIYIVSRMPAVPIGVRDKLKSALPENVRRKFE